MDRKKSFRKAKGLISRVSILYSLRDYNLDDVVDFPLGGDKAKIMNGKIKDVGRNIVVEALKAKTDRDLLIKLRLKVQGLEDEDIQQLANTVMRIIKISIPKKINEINSSKEETVKQSTINKIGKINNSCIYLLETSCKEIVYRARKDLDSTILEGLSTRVLVYITSLIRRYMIYNSLDEVINKYNSGQLNDCSDGALSIANTCQSFLERVVGVIKSRGIEGIEEQIKESDKDVKEYVSKGYTRRFC